MGIQIEDWGILVWDCGLGLRFGIGDCELGLVIYEWELDIIDWGWGLKLGIVESYCLI